MTIKTKRPPSVWLTQILLALFALLWFAVGIFNLTMLLRGRVGEGVSIIRLIIGYSVIFGFVTLLVGAFWALAKRKEYGRWLSLVALIVTWAITAYLQLRRPTGPYQYYKYDNPAQVAGGVLFQVFLHGLFLALILHMAFGKSISEFFRREGEPG